MDADVEHESIHHWRGFSLAGARLRWAEFMKILGAEKIVWVAAEIIKSAGLTEFELTLVRTASGLHRLLGRAFGAGGDGFGSGVIGEPAKVLDGRLERLVIQALAEAFVAGGLGDLEGDQAAGGAEFAAGSDRGNCRWPHGCW